MMRVSSARSVAGIVLLMGFAHLASATDILIADTKLQPESLTAALGVY